jgi:hypothetical protein
VPLFTSNFEDDLPDRNLAEETNLRKVFVERPEALAPLKQMAENYAAARAMVAKNLRRYERIQQASLKLKPLPEGKVALTCEARAPQTEWRVTLAPNELLVLVYDR